MTSSAIMSKGLGRATLLLLSVLALSGCITRQTGQTGNPPAGTKQHPPNQTTPSTPAKHGGVLRLPLSIAIDDPAMQSLSLSDPRLFALGRCIEMPLMRALPDGSLT